jgi:DNA adenine methylase
VTVKVPPIKSQGIKTKLIPWIKGVIPPDFDGVWIEPFMGTGAVAFNVAPEWALLADANPHLINFYQAIADKQITPGVVRSYLLAEGANLLAIGGDHYYAVRERFNQEHDPLDFLFLNRAGFNGMIRFNQKGKANVPFCRKPNRFSAAYITKIVNQVNYVARLLAMRSFTFVCQDFRETIAQATADDIIYCDPPYIGRHVDYYNGWDDEREQALFDALADSPARFILSTWHHNDYRANDYIDSLWGQFNVLTREHFYHVGAREENRNPMVEALITNFLPPTRNRQGEERPLQLALLEEPSDYIIL